nr:hypothetical protein [Aquabacterium sp.]
VPHRALATSGGGALAADPRDPQGMALLSGAFELDVAPVAGWADAAPAYGQRVHLRFELAPAPLARQLWLALRRLFLSHFET